MKNGFVILVLVGFLGCSGPDQKPPADLIPRDRFVQVLADVHVIEARISHEMVVDQRTDSPAQRYYEEMYTERGITKEQYVRTYRWYTEHPDVMKALYDEVLQELGGRKEKGSMPAAAL